MNQLADWAVGSPQETSGWARLLAHSITPTGEEIASFELLMWRGVLAEFNTHRMFGRNSASSRAIPVATMLERVEQNPFVPRRFPVNKAGMSATEYIELNDRGYGELWAMWLHARDLAVTQVRRMHQAGVHKQIVNRLLEPWMWHSVIVTATEWQNFFDLRISEHAQPEIHDVALAMRTALQASTPQELEPGQWHLPLVTDEERVELSLYQQIVACVARTAASTYGRHLDRDIAKETTRFEGLKDNRHMSPFEHAATPGWPGRFYAHLRGWECARYRIERDIPLVSWP